jgi:hypothetical protein
MKGKSTLAEHVKKQRRAQVSTPSGIKQKDSTFGKEIVAIAALNNERRLTKVKNARSAFRPKQDMRSTSFASYDLDGVLSPSKEW